MLSAEQLHLVLYEIALSIGNSLDLRPMLQQALSTYLRKINCSAGVVLELGRGESGRNVLEPVHTIPRSFGQSEAYAAILEHLPTYVDDQQLKQLLAGLPARFSLPDGICHIMELSGFGLMVVVSRHDELDERILKSLRRLNEKLGAACQACRQRDALQAGEKKALDERRRQKAIFDTVQAGIVVIDAQSHTIIEANPAALQMIGVTREQAIGQVCHEFICPAERGKCPITDLCQMVDNAERTLIAADGSQLPILKTVTAVELAGREVLIESFVDISERMIAEEQRRAKELAVAANEAKSAFLANMSHEIRTPMTAILGCADILLEDMRGCAIPAEQKQAARTIKRNGEHLLNIINDILDLSKVEAGKIKVERVACSIIELVSDATSLMKGQAQDAGLSFKIEFEGPIPESINTDPVRLRQILVNLVGNAIKFTESGGINIGVKFITHGDKPQIQFDVMDTGIGMTAGQVSKLFQPFSQADASTTRQFGGTGLGLMISRRFAQLLGGDVTVISSRPGVGTQMRATIESGTQPDAPMISNPCLAEVRGKEQVQDVSAAVVPAVLPQCSILLAEDNPTNQMIVIRLLEKAGAQITAVDNGAVALERALVASNSGRPFDLVLMDMQMPVMDGYQATARLREKGYTGPIVALTAHAMSGDEEKCIQAGCNAYAVKPINRAKLIQTINTQLADRGRQLASQLA